MYKCSTPPPASTAATLLNWSDRPTVQNGDPVSILRSNRAQRTTSADRDVEGTVLEASQQLPMQFLMASYTQSPKLQAPSPGTSGRTLIFLRGGYPISYTGACRMTETLVIKSAELLWRSVPPLLWVYWSLVCLAVLLALFPGCPEAFR